MCCAPYAAVEATVVEATNQLRQIKWTYVISYKKNQNVDSQKGGQVTLNMWCMAEFLGFQTLVEEELQILKPTGEPY
jgi:uncharacterized protein YgbK (DUF1537 family)